MTKTILKVTEGYVNQWFIDGRCFEQEFIALKSEFFDTHAKLLPEASGLTQLYFPFDMIQPDKKDEKGEKGGASDD